MSFRWDFYWAVRDDGLYVWENGEVIAKIHPDHFTALIAELAEHVRWQEVEQTKKQ